MGTLSVSARSVFFQDASSSLQPTSFDVSTCDKEAPLTGSSVWFDLPNCQTSPDVSKRQRPRSRQSCAPKECGHEGRSGRLVRQPHKATGAAKPLSKAFLRCRFVSCTVLCSADNRIYCRDYIHFSEMYPLRPWDELCSIRHPSQGCSNSQLSCNPTCTGIVKLVQDIGPQLDGIANPYVEHMCQYSLQIDEKKLRHLNELAKATVFGLNEPYQLRSRGTISPSFDAAENQLYSLLLFLNNGGLLQLTSTVDYDAGDDEIRRCIADKLSSGSIQALANPICPAALRVLFGMALLYVDSCRRAQWPVECGDDYYIHSKHDLCFKHPQGVQSALLTSMRATQGTYWRVCNFGKLCKQVVFTLPLLKYEHQRSLTDEERGDGPACRGCPASDGPFWPEMCNQADLCANGVDEAKFLQCGGTDKIIIFGTQCGHCGFVNDISPLMPPEVIMADGHPYYCKQCTVEVKLQYSGSDRTVGHFVLMVEGMTPAKQVDHFRTVNERQVQMCTIEADVDRAEDDLITTGHSLRQAATAVSQSHATVPAEGSDEADITKWSEEHDTLVKSQEDLTRRLKEVRSTHTDTLQKAAEFRSQAIAAHKSYMEKPPTPMVVTEQSNSTPSISGIVTPPPGSGSLQSTPARQSQAVIPVPTPNAGGVDNPHNTEQTSDKAPSDDTPQAIRETWTWSNLLTKEQYDSMKAPGACLDGKSIYSLNINTKIKDIAKEVVPKLKPMTMFGLSTMTDMPKYHKELLSFATYLRDLGLLDLFEMMKNSPGRILIISDADAYGQGDSSVTSIQNLARRQSLLSPTDQALIFGPDYLSFHTALEEVSAQRDENSYLIVQADRLQERGEYAIKALTAAIPEEARISISTMRASHTWSIFDYFSYLLHA